MKASLTILVILAFAADLAAQPLIGPAVCIRTGKQPRLITRFIDDTLYLRAWDTYGTPITTLDSTDLLITVARDTAEIVRFEKTNRLVPAELAISFVLDNSGSMFHTYDSLTKYLDRFLDSLGHGAQMSAMTFDNTERQPTYDGTGREQLFLASCPFTEDAAQLTSFWHFYDSIRSRFTPLFDAMWKSLDHIADRRKAGDSLRTDVLIAVTDGDDNCSSTKLDRLQALSSAMHVPLFVVNFRSDPDWRLVWLVTHSGGKAFSAGTLRDLRQVLTAIRRSLATGYRVVFALPMSGPSAPR